MAPLIRVETPEGLFVPRGYSGLVRALPEGVVVQTSTDGIFEWDSTTRRLLRITWFGEGLGASSISIAGDVFFLVGHRLHVWRRATQAIEALIEVTPPLCFSADGTHVGEVKPDQVIVRRLADGGTVGALPRPYDGGSVELGHEGRWVLFAKEECPQSGSCTTDYAAYDVVTKQPAASGYLIGDDAQVGLSFDGRAVEYDGRTTGVTPLDATLPRIPKGAWPRIPALKDLCVAFTRAGERSLAWVGDQLLDLDADRPLLTDDESTKAVAVSPDGAFVAQLRFGSKAAVIPVATPAAPRVFDVKGYPEALAVQDDGALIVAATGALTRADGTRVALPEKLSPAEVQASRDGRVLAVRFGYASEPRGPVVVIANGEMRPGPAREARTHAARALALSPDGALLAIATWDGIEVWETAPYRKLRTIETAMAIALAFSPDGRRLHALQRDLSVRVFPD